MMSWDDVRHWSEQGMEFGSHSITHADLTALTDRALHDELKDSKTMKALLRAIMICSQ